MATQLHTTLETDLVTARSARTILRETNRDTGEYIRDVPLARKFTRQAYLEYPDIVRRRTRNYAERKRRKVGHDIPNVLSGRMRSHVPVASRITATSNGGRIYIRNYFPMRESTRQELEVLSSRDKQRITDRQQRTFATLANDPKYRRKRRVKGSR